MVVDFDLAARSRNFLLVSTGDRTQAVVERGPDSAVRLIISERPSSRCAVFPGKAQQLSAEAHELINPVCQICSLCRFFDIGFLCRNGIGVHACTTA